MGGSSAGTAGHSIKKATHAVAGDKRNDPPNPLRNHRRPRLQRPAATYSMVYVMTRLQEMKLIAEGSERNRLELQRQLDAQRLRADTAEADLLRTSDALLVAKQRIADFMFILKNPTDEMVEAGNNSAAIQMEHDSELGSYAWIDNSAEVLAAMLDAALNPNPEAESHERLCPGCGAKGWTANCDQCIPY